MLQGLTLSSLAYHYSKTKLETKNILHHGATFRSMAYHFSKPKICSLFFFASVVPSKSIQKHPENKNSLCSLTLLFSFFDCNFSLFQFFH